MTGTAPALRAAGGRMIAAAGIALAVLAPTGAAIAVASAPVSAAADHSTTGDDSESPAGPGSNRSRNARQDRPLNSGLQLWQDLPARVQYGQVRAHPSAAPARPPQSNVAWAGRRYR